MTYWAVSFKRESHGIFVLVYNLTHTVESPNMNVNNKNNGCSARDLLQIHHAVDVENFKYVFILNVPRLSPLEISPYF